MTGKEESEVQSECLDYLTTMGLYVWRNNTGAYNRNGRLIRYGKKGSSDILGIAKDGRFLAVEVKREKGGVLSDDQKEFLFNITKNGGVAIVVNSLESLVDQLKENRVF